MPASPASRDTKNLNEGILILVTLATFVVVGSSLANYYHGITPFRFGSTPHVAVAISSVLVIVLMVVARLYYLRITEEVNARIRLAESASSSLKKTYSGLMDALTVALDTRDHETHGHAVRVVALALAIADKLNLSQKERQNLILGGILHDIGKIGIPDSILYKIEPFTAEEWNVMKRHTEIGYRMVHRVPLLHDCSPVILHHHERWDGTGYPFGLSGHEIPIEAQIFAVADAVDAMTSQRPYKKALSLNEVYAELARCRGTHFAPHVVDVFMSLPKEEVAAILHGAQDTVREESWFEELSDELSEELLKEKKSESQEERNRSLLAEQFASFAAHEINNPLTVISTAAQMLNSNQSNPEYSKTLVRRILSAVEDVSYILNDLRALTASNDLSSAVSANELVEEVVDELEPLATRDGVDVKLQFQNPLPRILCDRAGFKRALMNLIKNAIEAAREDPSKRTVTIRTRAGSRRVSLAIHNWGPVIETATMGRMFKPFYTTKKSGTGLGLVVVQKIVEGHNGRIAVRSNERYGTVFRVTVPAYGLPQKRAETVPADDVAVH